MRPSEHVCKPYHAAVSRQSVVETVAPVRSLVDTGRLGIRELTPPLDRTIVAGVMKRIPVQGVHHITLVGSTRQSALDFWEGVLGMPLLFEQPNLGRPEENHLYFDPGDGRLITVFTNEQRSDDPSEHPRGIGHLEHIAFQVSRAVQTQVAKRLEERGIPFKAFDRGFMDSIYFSDPNGLRLELACYKFVAPEGIRETDILRRANAIRLKLQAHHITDEHVAGAIEELMSERDASANSAVLRESRG